MVAPLASLEVYEASSLNEGLEHRAKVSGQLDGRWDLPGTFLKRSSCPEELKKG